MTEGTLRGRTRPAEGYPPPPAAGGTAPDTEPFDDLPILRSLLRISHAVSCANYFDEALEVIADEACISLRAASLSISRWERGEDVLRTLINVGDLGPGEQRWPLDETYPITGDRHVCRLLQHGLPYASAVDDPDAHPASVSLLRRLGKDAEVAVAIMHGDAMWGELWATSVGPRRFGADDVQLLQAVAAQTAVALGRTELFSTAWRHAHQDPLTGAANRRAMEAYFDAIAWATAAPVMLICDVDGFKLINDSAGHPAGDAVLCSVSDALHAVAATVDGAMVARLGGDEFCVVLPRSAMADAERYIADVAGLLRSGPRPDLTLGWGASPWSGSGTWRDQLAAADAALMMAKRTSAPLLGVAPVRTDDRYGRRGLDHLVPDVVAAIDERGPADAGAALTILAGALARVTAATHWSVDDLPTDGSPTDGAPPPTAEHLVEVDDDGSTLVVQVRTGSRRHVARIRTARPPTELALLEPYVRVLAHYCRTRLE